MGPKKHTPAAVLTIVVNGWWWRKHEVVVVAKHFREFSVCVLVLMMLLPVLTMEIPSSCSAGEMHASPYFNVNSGVVLISDYWDFMVQCRNFSRLEKAVRDILSEEGRWNFQKRVKALFILLSYQSHFNAHMLNPYELSANFLFSLKNLTRMSHCIVESILSYS